MVEADNQERVLNGFEVSESGFKTDGVIVMKLADLQEPWVSEDDYSYLDLLYDLNDSNSFMFMNWYLVPTKNGEPVYELNNDSSNYDTTVAPAADCEYWFTHADFSVGGAPITPYTFYRMLYTARQKSFYNFKICYNETGEIIPYAYVRGYLSMVPYTKGAVQVIPVEDLEKVYDVWAEARREAACIHSTDEKLIQAYYDDFMKYDFYYWCKSEDVVDDYLIQFQDNAAFRNSPDDILKNYYFLPLDKEGNEIRQLNY